MMCVCVRVCVRMWKSKMAKVQSAAQDYCDWYYSSFMDK